MTTEEDIRDNEITTTSSTKATATAVTKSNKFLSGSSMYIITGLIGLFVLFFGIYVSVSVYKKTIHVRASRKHIVEQIQKVDPNYTALHTRSEIQPHVTHSGQHGNPASNFSPVFDDDIYYEEVDVYNSADESNMLENYQVPSETNNQFNPHTYLSRPTDSYQTPVADEYLTPVADTYLTPVEDAYLTPVEDAYLTPVEDAYLTPVEDAYSTPVANARHEYIDVIE
ncbi:hypothetical protein MHBO_003643 [Bonamia ostreae]|uniref:Uncharacterized protein n=1 Tax=Bonamia ostreae TaxID=126728 RepID=A0ABV2AR24_9EUKA